MVDSMINFISDDVNNSFNNCIDDGINGGTNDVINDGTDDGTNDDFSDGANNSGGSVNTFGEKLLQSPIECIWGFHSLHTYLV